MDKTLSVINALEGEGIIKKYAIGGAIGLLFYAKGYRPKEEHVEIEGIPVQFLEPPSALVREALDNAVDKDFGGVPTRVFQYEHLLAIMVETNRPKDRARLAQALESAQPDQARLKEILDRYNLNDKWARIVS